MKGTAVAARGSDARCVAKTSCHHSIVELGKTVMRLCRSGTRRQDLGYSTNCGVGTAHGGTNTAGVRPLRCVCRPSTRTAQSMCGPSTSTAIGKPTCDHWSYQHQAHPAPIRNTHSERPQKPCRTGASLLPITWGSRSRRFKSCHPDTFRLMRGHPGDHAGWLSHSLPATRAISVVTGQG